MVHRIEPVGPGGRPDHADGPTSVYEESPCRSLQNDANQPPVHTLV